MSEEITPNVEATVPMPTPPPTPAANAAEATGDESPEAGLSHELSAEAISQGDSFQEPEPEGMEVEKPEDAPSFPPLHALPRSTRAAFAEAAAKVNFDDAKNLDDENSEVGDLKKWALAERLAADMEAAMDIVVYPIPASKAAWERWKETHKAMEDDSIMRLFSWYMTTMKPGEAQPSPTS